MESVIYFTGLAIVYVVLLALQAVLVIYALNHLLPYLNINTLPYTIDVIFALMMIIQIVSE